MFSMWVTNLFSIFVKIIIEMTSETIAEFFFIHQENEYVDDFSKIQGG